MVLWSQRDTDAAVSDSVRTAQLSRFCSFGVEEGNGRPKSYISGAVFDPLGVRNISPHALQDRLVTSIRTSAVTTLLPLAMAFAIGQLSAQADAHKEQQKKFCLLRAEKMALDVFQHNGWTFDYDEARERAKKEGKVIFTYFTRSYAG